MAQREVTYRNMSAMDGDPDAVRAHVARITTSELFAGAERLCRFLRFTVESKLNGREADVKEYTLGREVFDRGDDYDPRLDPIVRVEARRLRSRLAEYYGGPGRDETLRLEYPEGSYVPTVSAIGQRGEQSPVSRAHSPWWVIGGLVLVALAVVATIAIPRLLQPPMVAPIPATWLAWNDGRLDGIDVALAQAVDEALANQPGSRVVAWPVIAQYRRARDTNLPDIASQFHAGQLLVIMVRDDGALRRISVFDVEEPQGRKRLALTYYADTSLDTTAVQATYANRIVRDLNEHRTPTASVE